jgi:hypothetical protein
VPPVTETVIASVSTAMSGGSFDSEIRAPPGESATALKECRVPTALTRECWATSCCTSATEVGWWIESAL